MKLMHIMCAGLLAAVPMGSMAAGVGNQVDLYYISAGIDTAVGDDDGDGFGVKGQFAFADNLFFNGEYQSANYDDSDADLDQLRLGVGYNTSLNAQTVLYGLAEYARVKIKDGGSESENGFGLHAGLQFNINDAFGLNARIGYVDIGDFGDGVEFLVGASYSFSKPFGVFADYRVSKLDGDLGDIDLDDFRVGVRFTF